MFDNSTRMFRSDSSDPRICIRSIDRSMPQVDDIRGPSSGSELSRATNRTIIYIYPLAVLSSCSGIDRRQKKNVDATVVINVNFIRLLSIQVFQQRCSSLCQ